MTLLQTIRLEFAGSSPVGPVFPDEKFKQENISVGRICLRFFCAFPNLIPGLIEKVKPQKVCAHLRFLCQEGGVPVKISVMGLREECHIDSQIAMAKVAYLLEHCASIDPDVLEAKRIASEGNGYWEEIQRTVPEDEMSSYLLSR
jgi:hypothetical protein